MSSFTSADSISSVIQSHSEKTIAVEWVINSVAYGKKLPRHKAQEYVDIAYEAAWANDLDPKLVLGIIKQESMFNEKARSSYGAVGLMQVVPRWHKKRFKGKSYTNPRANVFAGASYLRELIDKTGSVKKAVKLYSGGARSYHAKVTQHRDSLIAYTEANRFNIYSMN